jgi:putative ABC transport system permease protein
MSLAMGDLRHALRQLARTPGFTAVALVTLAVGIGSSVAIFSVVDGVLLRPLPYRDPERLVVVQETLLPRFPEFAVSRNSYFQWQQQATSFERLAALHDGAYNLTAAGEPSRVSAGRVTANTFATLGVQPALGRDFAPEEDLPGRADVAILSHGFWQRQFGGRPEVLNQAIQLDGRPFTVVGVMPRGFQLDVPLDLFTPAAYGRSDVHDIGVIGRLRPGVTLAQARAEMSLVSERIAKEHHGRWGVKVTRLLDFKVREVRPLLLALLGAVGFLLLIVCANVAGLLLARGTVRAREIAVRSALGASRARLVRHLVTESLLLAAIGALLGVLIAKGMMSALLALAPVDLPRAQEIVLDARAVAFACLLAVGTALGFGLTPALAATRLELPRVLRSGGRGASAGLRPQRLRGAIVVVEVATALVLLVGAGLLIRSFARLNDVHPGFRPAGALAITLSLPYDRYPTGPQQAAFAQDVAARLAVIPGVESAGATQGFPFSSITNHVFYFRIAGLPAIPGGATASAFSVTGDYFGAKGIRLLRGRVFDARDGANSPRVTIINEAMARKFFAGVDPIGRRIDAVRRGPDQWHEIVGVVGDVKYERLDGGATMQGYAPLSQASADWGALTFVVRTAGTAAALAPAVRAAIHQVDPGQAITSMRPVGDWIAESMARQRFTTLLFAIFSAVALLLAAVGIYGVMAHAVVHRTAEIGIRRALGAQTGDVVGPVLGRGARLVALGVAGGLLGSLLLTRFLEKMLFGVRAHDPLTFGGIAALLALVAAIACIVPARRAARVDPMTALRAE